MWTLKDVILSDVTISRKLQDLNAQRVDFVEVTVSRFSILIINIIFRVIFFIDINIASNFLVFKESRFSLLSVFTNCNVCCRSAA